MNGGFLIGCNGFLREKARLKGRPFLFDGQKVFVHVRNANGCCIASVQFVDAYALHLFCFQVGQFKSGVDLWRPRLICHGAPYQSYLLRARSCGHVEGEDVVVFAPPLSLGREIGFLSTQVHKKPHIVRFVVDRISDVLWALPNALILPAVKDVKPAHTRMSIGTEIQGAAVRVQKGRFLVSFRIDALSEVLRSRPVAVFQSMAYIEVGAAVAPFSVAGKKKQVAVGRYGGLRFPAFG
ncbi:MAG: Uncharacterised protein [Flavobacteriia bacterium]|nr:MAG: Uncharacterised protein [Flavobacteriia bacterium]